MSYNILATDSFNTVVSEYISEEQNVLTYQSEADLEKEFIERLKSIGYEYLNITCEKDLILNLRKQLESLNNITFTNGEWNKFFTEHISNANDTIKDKTNTIQNDYIKSITREDGSLVNIKLLDKDRLHNNKVQVINQYESESSLAKNRYDVTILVNGLPLVHVELKRRGVALKEAFRQINRYQRESFWSNSGLYEFVQIFVISNGTSTKYYSNTTRDMAIKMKNGEMSKKVSNSFEFTSYWADQKNKSILDLMDFTKTFFSKNNLLNILTKYCIYTEDESLLVLRPYQIVAVEKILNKIELSNNSKVYSSTEAGGYLFHTTGSGKTLSSFVAAQLVSKLDYIDKVLFVVDRKDLDAQTIREYDRFEKGAVNGTNSTEHLKEQLEDSSKRILVTTIQKLGIFIKKYKNHAIYNKHVVIIFDECHRSQFGELHKSVTKSFKKYHLFGFTGTPIYSKNKVKSSSLDVLTTEQVFGRQLHAYTIVDAIHDENVLPFSIDYIDTFKISEKIKDTKVSSIDTDSIILHPDRIANNVTYVLDHYNQKTKRVEKYTHKGKVVSGFNSLFACSSIKMAIMYYNEFQKQIKERQLEDSSYSLKVATI